MSFGIRSLFGLVSAIAVAVYLLVSAPTLVAVPMLVLLHIVVAALLVAGLVYGAGRLRAFCMAAMIPAGATILALSFMLFVWLLAGPYNIRSFTELANYFERFAFSFRVWSGAAWIIGPIVGLLSVAARGALHARQQRGDSKLPPGATLDRGDL